MSCPLYKHIACQRCIAYWLLMHQGAKGGGQAFRGACTSYQQTGMVRFVTKDYHSATHSCNSDDIHRKIFQSFASRAVKPLLLKEAVVLPLR